MKSGLIGIVAVVATLAAGITSITLGQAFPQRAAADVNGDGVIDGADLAIVLSEWGPAPPPWAVVLEQCPDPSVVTDEKLRAAILATGLPWRVQDIGTGIEMLLVPPGSFMMGCSPSPSYGCSSDGRDQPLHSVTITRPFYLGRFEVTQAQWTAVMGDNPSQFQGVADSQFRPVERVSWNMIQQFNTATGLRLPTEAEWEYACRAGTTTAFNNGSDDDATLSELGWFIGNNSPNGTKPVGQKLANALGFHDMHGNVLEWVQDYLGVDYYADSPGVDPAGPATGGARVLRGGSFRDRVTRCYSFNRHGGGPGFGDLSDGFRVARTP